MKKKLQEFWGSIKSVNINIWGRFIWDLRSGRKLIHRVNNRKSPKPGEGYRYPSTGWSKVNRQI